MKQQEEDQRDIDRYERMANLIEDQNPQTGDNTSLQDKTSTLINSMI